MRLIFVTGVPASGKTTIATFLSQLNKFEMISKDDIKVSLFETFGFKTNAEKKRLSLEAESILFKRFNYNIRNKRDLVVDSTFESLKKFLYSMNASTCQIYWIICTADPSVLANRYNARLDSPQRHIALSVQNIYPFEEGKTRKLPPVDSEFVKKQQDGIRVNGGNVLTVDTTNIAEDFLTLCKHILGFCGFHSNEVSYS